MARPRGKRGRGRGISRADFSDLRTMRSNRLQPNEPLHMTTRAAAASVTGSVASNGSSRSSFGEASRNVGGDDIDSDRPAKVVRVAREGDFHPLNSLAASADDVDDEDTIEVEWPGMSATSLRRDSAEDGLRNGDPDSHEDEEDHDGEPTSQEALGEQAEQADGTEAAGSEEYEEALADEADETGAELDEVEEALEEAAAAEAAAEAEEEAAAAAAAAAADEGDDEEEEEEEATAASQAERSGSNGHLKPPGDPKVRGTRSTTRLTGSPLRALGQTGKTRSADLQGAETDEAGNLLKRMPGRRRAPHPDINIEVDLRRQLELKVAYRAIVKALKPVLIELAERTKQELESNNDAHKQFAEFDDVTAELDDSLKQRMRMLQAELSEEEARMERDVMARKELLQRKLQYAIRDHRDDCLLRCQNQFLTVLRDAENEDDSDATDYEDGIVPKLYHIHPDGSRTKIPDGYDSRSRFFVETENKWKEQVARQDFRKEQQEFEASSLVRKPGGFAVYDPERRAVGNANFNLRRLEKATVQVEQNKELATQRLANVPANRLHTLADATMTIGPLIKQADVKPWMGGGPSQGQGVTPVYQVSGPNGLIEGPKSETAMSSGKQRTTRRRRQSSRSQDLYSQVPPTAKSYNSSQGSPVSGLGPAVAPYNPPPQHVPPTGHSMRGTQSALQRVQSYMPFGSYPSSQTKQDDSPPPPAAASVPNPPSAGNEYDRHQANENSSHDQDQGGPNRKTRPGPRAFYAEQGESKSGQQNAWEPFTNTMGPPAYMPRYVKAVEHSRQPSSASTSPITPVNNPLPSAPRSGNEWPGFSTNPSGPGQPTGIDSRIGQTPAFPGLSGPFQSGSGPPLSQPTTANDGPRGQSPRQRWGQVSSPEANQSQHEARAPPPPPSHTRPLSQTSHPLSQPPGPPQGPPQNPTPLPPPQSQQPPPMYGPPHSFYQPNSYYGPYQHPPQPPPQHATSRPPFNPPSSTGPLLPHPFYFQSSQGSPRSMENSPRQTAPNAASPQISDTSKQPSWQSREYHNRSQPQAQTPTNFTPLAPRTPLPPLRQDHMQHYPGQTGHQRILPATLDPSRRGARPPEPAASTPTEGPSSTPPTVLTHGQQYGHFPAFTAAPQPPPSHPHAHPPHQPRQASPRDSAQHRQSQPPPASQGASPSVPPSVAARGAPTPPGRQGHGSPPQRHEQQHATPSGPPPPPPSQQQQQRHHPYGWHHYANILPAPRDESAVARRDREAEAHAQAQAQTQEKDKETERKEREWKFTRSRYG